jgi:hypothetical protein
VRFAYADPPYLGCGKLYTSNHPDALIWDDPQAHVDLAHKLVDEYQDGWVLSCNPKDLRVYLPELPDDVRIGAWVKPFASFKPNVNPAFAWECVLFRGGRKRTREELTVRDWLSEPIQLKAGLTGAKPPRFNRWVLDLLNYQDGDQLDDLFPGSFGMQQELKVGVLL